MARQNPARSKLRYARMRRPFGPRASAAPSSQLVLAAVQRKSAQAKSDPYGLNGSLAIGRFRDLMLQAIVAGSFVRDIWIRAYCGQASLVLEASTFTFASHVACLTRYMTLAQGLPKCDASVSAMQQAFCRPWVAAASSGSSGPTSPGSRQTRSLQLKRPRTYYSGDT